MAKSQNSAHKKNKERVPLFLRNRWSQILCIGVDRPPQICIRKTLRKCVFAPNCHYKNRVFCVLPLQNKGFSNAALIKIRGSGTSNLPNVIKIMGSGMVQERQIHKTL